VIIRTVTLWHTTFKLATVDHLQYSMHVDIHVKSDYYRTFGRILSAKKAALVIWGGHGGQKDFFMVEAIVDFSRQGLTVVRFYQLETKEETFLLKTY